MNTQNPKIDSKKTSPLPDHNIQGIQGMVSRIKEALIEEDWLPLGFRTIVGNEISTMDQMLGASEIKIEELANQAHLLAFNAYSYKGLRIGKSKTIANIHMLDIELQSYLPAGKNASTALILEESNYLDEAC